MSRATELANKCDFWKPLSVPSDWDSEDFVCSPTQLEAFYQAAKRDAYDEIFEDLLGVEL